MIINTNLNAMNAYRSMGIASTKQGLAMEKLSSGNKINRAADDAAGLAISEKMRSQINGLVQASRNAQDGVSMIQTAEGTLSETQVISQRMKELAVQSANGIYEEEDRKLINQEFTQLKKEIDRIAEDTEFNGSKLLNGDRSGKEIKITKTGNKVGTITTDTLGGKKAIDHTKLKPIVSNIKESDLEKFGEGKFDLRITRNGEDVKIELLDESKFNDNKKYIMDSYTIRKGIGNDTHKIKLAGIDSLQI